MKKKWYLLPLFCVIACFIFAAIVRVSYPKNLLNRAQTYTYNANAEDTTSFLEGKGFRTGADLVSGSDIIVQGKWSGERKATNDALYTPVNVEKVNKGSASLVGKTILVVQQMNVIENNEQAFYYDAAQNAMIPLQKDVKYLLLLKHVPSDASKTVDSMQYYPVSESAFGIYRLSNKKQPRILKSTEEIIHFNELQNFDLYTSKQAQLDKYYTYKADVFAATHQ